jgi:hypothetical protein
MEAINEEWNFNFVQIDTRVRRTVLTDDQQASEITSQKENLLHSV